MIETVQRETRMAVEHMNDGTKQVDRGVQTTTQAGDSLLEIIREAEQVGDMVAQIASAATEQASTTEQIRNSVASIAQITQESAVGAQQTAKACEDLSQLALDLQQVVARFTMAQADDTRSHRSPSKTQPGLQRHIPPAATHHQTGPLTIQ